MTYAIQWVRSLIFNGLMYLALPIVGLIYFPWALISPKGALAGCHRYCVVVMWLARWVINLKVEYRGTPPTGEVMVAAKHQSFFDVLTIFHAIPRGRFIMKSILRFAPVIGLYGLRIGCVPVDRGKRGAAITKMLADVKAGAAMPGQLIIYPQGTRVPAGEKRPYKKGTGALYRELGQPCVPVAINVGDYWPKRGVYRRPGTVVIAFLDPIDPGMEPAAFMKLLEERIETASDSLSAEAAAALGRA